MSGLHHLSQSSILLLLCWSFEYDWKVWDNAGF
jgi:hypothetical protein